MGENMPMLCHLDPFYPAPFHILGDVSRQNITNQQEQIRGQQITLSQTFGGFKCQPGFLIYQNRKGYQGYVPHNQSNPVVPKPCLLRRSFKKSHFT